MNGIVETHCHIIPGVDDGASTKREVRALLKKEYECGVRKIILTPHYRKTMFEAPEVLIKKRAAYVESEIRSLGLDMEVYLGCEYHANSDMLEEVRCESRFRINGGKYILVEFSHRHNFLQIRNWLYELLQAGFRPIVAHIERFPQIVEPFDRIKELKSLGALIQVDTGAIIGKDGLRTKWLVRKMLKEDMIDLVGSDAHDMKERCPDFDLCEKYIVKKMGKEYAKKLLVENPQRLLANE